MSVRRFCIIILFVLAILCVPEVVYGHGAGYRQSGKAPVSLEFYYSTGDLMAYQEAKVYSPKDEKFAFQSGRTDEYGRFAFTPDSEGQWRVIVKDSESHLAEAVVDVTADSIRFKADGGAAGDNMEFYLRAALGVSLLFNIAAFAAVKKIRKGQV